MPDIEKLAAEIKSGNRRSLAQTITLAESARSDEQKFILDLLSKLGPIPKSVQIIGITGAPGVGKSSLIGRLGLYALSQNRKVAVLAIDPTSPLAGGSILGDKSRMVELAADDRAFIRPSPSGGAMGGLHSRIFETLHILSHAGFDLIFLETVGIGQGETAITTLADLTLLLLQPGGGDDLQGIKKGIMEVADLFVVTKMDGTQSDLARHALADYRHALGFRTDQTAPVTAISSVTDDGIAALYALCQNRLQEFHKSGLTQTRHAQRKVAWFRARALEAAQKKALADPVFQAQEDKILSHQIDPIEAIFRVIT